MTAERQALPSCTALASQSKAGKTSAGQVHLEQRRAGLCDRQKTPGEGCRGQGGHLRGGACSGEVRYRQRQPARPVQCDRRAGSPRRCRGRSGPCAGHHGYHQARQPWGPPRLQRRRCPAAVGLLHPGSWILVLGNVLSDAVPSLCYCTCLHQNAPFTKVRSRGFAHKLVTV